ncbi:hypothetical protein B2G71_09390 [Novosphingobium sp. PC22D]|uniref:winged helix-turn-helix domain-containing protein n=1 Tax=Novosphingobium sp. PC22D TaxID=1962403 RepID=UPI000BF224D7|nr:winged helix-turn-helix domain-containing protein [Novosphingobium sp. PC22D]PEQ13032.1 hypothetical protein B2G71_09390 [Novosphingobium sp. PC22D]
MIDRASHTDCICATPETVAAPPSGPAKLFRWLSDTRLPAELDLRQFGWTLCPRRSPCDRPVLLSPPPPSAMGADWVAYIDGIAPEARSRIFIVRVDCPQRRASLLRLGFGEALAGGSPIFEVEARARLILARRNFVPKWRQVGPLLLDIVRRDAFVEGRAVRLHPREFELAWRLADRPGAAFTKEALIRDVWQMGFTPETNSLAVHVSRLRAKLGRFGLARMIETGPGGTYLLNSLRETAPGPGAPSTMIAREER